MIHTKETLASLNLMQLLDSISDSSGLHLVLKRYGLCSHVTDCDWWYISPLARDVDLNCVLYSTANERLPLFGTSGVAYPVLDLDRVEGAKEQYHSLPHWEGKQLELRQQLATFLSYHLASIQL